VTEKAEGIRLATHFYNSEEEIDTAVRTLEDYRRI
jgi:selenocysteine lyase/cysteine desulfurase